MADTTPSRKALLRLALLSAFIATTMVAVWQLYRSGEPRRELKKTAIGAALIVKQLNSDEWTYRESKDPRIVQNCVENWPLSGNRTGYSNHTLVLEVKPVGKVRKAVFLTFGEMPDGKGGAPTALDPCVAELSKLPPHPVIDEKASIMQPKWYFEGVKTRTWPPSEDWARHR